MNEFDSRKEFQTWHPDSAEELAKHCRSKWMSESISAALTKITLAGATTDETKGVAKFVHAFLNLAEKDEVTQPYPKRVLKTYDQVVEPDKPKTANT